MSFRQRLKWCFWSRNLYWIFSARFWRRNKAWASCNTHNKNHLIRKKPRLNFQITQLYKNKYRRIFSNTRPIEIWTELFNLVTYDLFTRRSKGKSLNSRDMYAWTRNFKFLFFCNYFESLLSMWNICGLKYCV